MGKRAAAVLLTCLLAACQGLDGPQPETSGRPSTTRPPLQRDHVVAVHDKALEADVARSIGQLQPTRAYRAVSVTAWNGRVLLMGAVIKPEQRRRAEQIARAANGTVEVLNELVLAEDSALDLFLPDTTREATLRRQFHLEGEGAPALRVLHGVAFLLGAAQSAADSEVLKEDLEDSEGIKWVVNHLDATP